MNKRFSLLLLVTVIFSSAVIHADDSIGRSGVCQAGVCLLDDFADIKGVNWEVPKSLGWASHPGAWRGEHVKNPTFLKYLDNMMWPQLNAQSYPLFRKMAYCSSGSAMTVNGTFKTKSGRQVYVRFFPVPMRGETHFFVSEIRMEYPIMTEQQQKQVLNELAEKWPGVVNPRRGSGNPFRISVSNTSVDMNLYGGFWNEKENEQMLQARANDVIFRRRLHQTTRFEGCCAVVY